MGRHKKEEVQEFVNNSNIEVHLDRDPNDPRLKETVDGASVEQVDINVPVE